MPEEWQGDCPDIELRLCHIPDEYESASGRDHAGIETLYVAVSIGSWQAVVTVPDRLTPLCGHVVVGTGLCQCRCSYHEQGKQTVKDDSGPLRKMQPRG